MKKYKYYSKAIPLPNGKRKYVRGKTKQELDRKVARIYQDIDLGLDFSCDPTFQVYAENWYTTTREPYVTKNTAALMRGELKNHIYPYIGETKVRDIRAPMIRNIMFRCSSLSRRTQSIVLGLMRGIFNSAVDDGVISRSPVPLTLKAGGRDSAEAEYLTDEQEATLLKVAEGTAAYPFIFTILRTGLRRGEVTALMWRDIDFDRSVIYVRRHAVADASGAPELVDGAKTAAGVRTVPIPSDLVAYLRGLKSKSSSLYVFPNSKGRVVSAARLSQIFSALDKRAGFHVHPHMLRHTYATKLFEAGLDIRQIQTILGHSDPGVTLKVYTHYRASMREDSTMQQVRAALGG